jgi:ribosomal protein L37AE/L43A
MESKSQAIRNEMSRYRGIIGQLEKEERKLRESMSVRSREIEVAERSMEGLLSGIAEEISGIRSKVEEFTSKKSTPRPAVSRDYAWDDRTAKGESSGGAAEGDVRGAPAPEQSGDRKLCSVCGCRAFWYEKEKVWKCYVCAYEEKDETESKDTRGEAEAPLEPERDRAERKPEFPNAGIDSIPTDFSSFHKLTTARSKTCPICRKKMDWHDSEKSWRCPHCAYHRMEF